MMRVLLAIDGVKSAKEIEKELGFYQVKCWRLITRLERNGIIFKLEDTKKGSPVYVTSRWYRILRLEDEIRKRLSSLSTSALPDTEEQNASIKQQSQPEN